MDNRIWLGFAAGVVLTTLVIATVESRVEARAASNRQLCYDRGGVIVLRQNSEPECKGLNIYRKS